MKEVKVKLTLDDDDAKKGVEDLTKETKKLDKEVGDVNESTNTLTDSLDKMTGGAITGFKGMVKGVKSVILGFRTLKGAIAASGIGLLIIAIGAVASAFTSTEEGQNKFAKLMAMIGAVTSVFIDRLASLGTLLIDVFTKPQKVFKDFRDSIKKYVTDQIALVTDGLGLLGSAIKKAFSGDFSGALDDAGAGLKKIYIETQPLYQATVALARATKDLVTEMTEEARIAGIIADQRAAADKLDRALIVDRAIANRERAKLLEQAIDKEKFSTEERIEFLKEAGRIEDEITQKEITASKLRLEAKIAENALGGSTKEDLDEEAQLRANLINLETAKLTKAKEVTSQILALNAEAKSAQDAIDAEKKAKDDQAILDEEARIKRESDNYDARLAGIRERNAKELAEKQAFEESKRAMEDATINHTKAGIGILSSLAGESKALQATALIAENAVGIAETVMSASKSISARTAAHNAIPLMIGAFPNPAKIADGISLPIDIASTKLSAGIGIATSGIALAKGLAALGKGGAGAGGGANLGGADAAGGATAPAFNLVEGSESNAIQQSIQGQDNAVKAFVVSGDVTTAQSADRRIVEGSGF
jgi:hypothetical protein